MDYKASSTKERFDELQKNPLFFCKLGTITVQDPNGYKQLVNAWVSCDQTINVQLYEKNLPKNDSKRRLFIIRSQILSNGEIDKKKEGKDIVEFEIEEFDPNEVSDWILIINDCLYNYRSGNRRHCHMTLFWALYTLSWNEEIIRQAMSTASKDAARNALYYISANIFAFSTCKQKSLVELFKETEPKLQTGSVPAVEGALNEIAPARDFNNFGFYEKVDYILNFGTQPGEREHLQKLYTTSRNSLIHFKYWMEHVGHVFYNYNCLEELFSYVDPLTQLSIVKRYLHDIRINLIEIDYSLIQNMRDTRYQAYVDVRYFVTTPGDNIDLVAPMFCDALLTLKKTKGKKIQDINGILDFAVRHSNKAYPKIDLGVKHFVPTCDGGLMHNSSFIGFIHYAILLTFDESKLTEDNLKKTVKYLLEHYATLQYHYCCKADDNRELKPDELEKCKKIVKTRSKWMQNGQLQTAIKESECSSLLLEPIKPNIWKRTPGPNDAILNLFVENVQSKDYIKIEDTDILRLKQSLLSWGSKYKSFSYMNGNAPEYLRKKEVSYYIVSTFYSPTTMVFYPNKCMFFSRKKSLFGAWDLNNLSPKERPEEVAQRAEAPIVFARTFNSLKNMFPNAEVGEDHIMLPFDRDILNKVLAYYHYRTHDFNPEKGYSEFGIWCKEFLSPRRINGVFYCTPKVSDSHEIVSGLPFFWCRGNECYCNMLVDQTLDKQSDWNKYTLYHAAEILGYKLIEETDKGNVPVEAVSNFAGEVIQAERLFARLICRSCGHMIFSTRRSLLDGSRFFACDNYQCSQYRKEIYLSRCNNCKRELIDSRDSKKCENGWVICPSCLACCNDDLFDRLIAKHRRDGYIPPRLLESQGKGHNNKDIFFCPKCGAQLGNIKVEEVVILEDGTEDVITHTEFGCPQCNVSFEKELEKYRNSLK